MNKILLMELKRGKGKTTSHSGLLLIYENILEVVLGWLIEQAFPGVFFQPWYSSVRIHCFSPTDTTRRKTGAEK
jgi:hypothetical protein